LDGAAFSAFPGRVTVVTQRLNAESYRVMAFEPPVQFVISRLRARSSRVVRLVPPGLIYPRLATLRAWRFDQVHGEISVVQLGDEVGGDCLPGAGFGAPDPIVVSTILHTGNVTFVGHHRA
jgi:hypothetical protein